MQVINDENFIFAEEPLKFGGLYKSTKSRMRFLNTFTPCIFEKTALQFLLYNASIWALCGILTVFPEPLGVMMKCNATELSFLERNGQYE